MKKILIIANGELSSHFMSRLYENRSNLHEYVVVSSNNIQNINSENFKFYNFDATSLSKLKAVVEGYFSQFIIAVDDKNDSLEVYKNLRQISKKTEIVMLSLWKIDDELKDDRHLEFVDGRDILSFRVIHHLPDMPVIADNIGLSDGEIMEVKVPVGSSYMYRHISSIQQRKWRIALIYRANEIILPKPNVMIRPNDTLLIVGDPNVLRNVFRSIKREKGQFPSPFGSNIYTFIDMRLMSEDRIKKLIDDSLYLHSKLNNKRLIFKIVNPTLGANLTQLKEINDKNIIVKFDYFIRDNSHIQGDVANFDIGLVLTDNEYFFKFKKLFYALLLPVLKLGNLPLSKIKQGVILSDGRENIENQSVVILDCSSQLNIDMKLYYFDTNTSNADTLTEHFESLNNLFDKSIEIQNTKDTNPLVKLSKRDDLLHFVALNESINSFDKFVFLSTNLNRQYKKLSSNHQLFIPIGS